MAHRTGLRRATLALGLAAGTLTVACAKDGTSPPVPSALAVIAGDGQSAAAGAAVADSLVVRVTDQNGNPVANVAVAWGVAGGGGTVSPGTSTTATDGNARTRWTLGTGVGAQAVSASVTGLTTVEFTATSVAGAPASALKVAGDTQEAPAGSALADSLVVRVRDAHGNAIEGAVVRWNVTAGGGSASPDSTQTNAQGEARTSWTVGTTAGAQAIATAVTGIATVSFTANAVPGPAAEVTVEPDQAELALAETVQLAASVTDEYGNAVPAAVVWTSSNEGVATVDETGLVSAVAEGDADITATAGDASGSATINVSGVNPLVIDEPDIALARVARAIDVTITATGGVPPYTWSVAAGALPPGVSLQADGTLTGAPTETGSFTATLRVTDQRPAHADRQLAIDVCEAAIDLAVGESLVLPFPHECGALLAEMNGAGYRIGVIARAYQTSNSGTLAQSVSGGLRFERRAEAAAEATLTPPAVAFEPQAILEDRALDPETRRLAIGTERAHTMLREHERRLFGHAAGPRPDVGPYDPALAVLAANANPDTLRTFFVTDPNDFNPENRLQIEARLRADGTNLLYYEETALLGTNEHATDAEVDAVLDYYDAHGKAIIDDVFGGTGPDGTTDAFQGGTRLTNDLDGNGKVIILQLRQVNMITNAAGYVHSCDLVPDTANYASGPFSCANSNEGEIFYMLRPNSPFYLGTVVHEIKHIASLMYAIYAGRGFNPLWIEEGTAEIAKELSSRNAAGFDHNQRLTFTQVYPGGSVTAATFGINTVLARARQALQAAPLNAVIGNPAPNTNNSTYYGSSWLFHRWLADQYAGGDVASFFHEMNVQGSDIQQIQATTGQTFAELLAQFMVALSVESENAARETSAYRTTSYDFQDITENFVAWTWPFLQGVGTFADGSTELTTVYSSTNFFELNSPGGVVLRLDLWRNDTEPLAPSTDGVLTITRVR